MADARVQIQISAGAPRGTLVALVRSEHVRWGMQRLDDPPIAVEYATGPDAEDVARRIVGILNTLEIIGAPWHTVRMISTGWERR